MFGLNHSDLVASECQKMWGSKGARKPKHNSCSLHHLINRSNCLIETIRRTAHWPWNHITSSSGTWQVLLRSSNWSSDCCSCWIRFKYPPMRSACVSLEGLVGLSNSENRYPQIPDGKDPHKPNLKKEFFRTWLVSSKGASYIWNPLRTFGPHASVTMRHGSPVIHLPTHKCPPPAGIGYLQLSSDWPGCVSWILAEACVAAWHVSWDFFKDHSH